MTTNKPKVLAYHVNTEYPGHAGVTLEALIRLSDYEALQSERDALVEALEAMVYRYAPNHRDCTDDGMPSCEICDARAALAKATTGEV